MFNWEEFALLADFFTMTKNVNALLLERLVRFFSYYPRSIQLGRKGYLLRPDISLIRDGLASIQIAYSIKWLLCVKV